MKKIFFIIFISITSQEKVIKVNAKISKKIGKQIYINECSGDLEKLVFWKQGEDFVSVGIGHFIWCSKERCSFIDSFPELRAFLILNKIKIPKKFLDKSPWHSQEELKADIKGARKLRQLMESTIDLQVKFMISKLQTILPYMLRNIKGEEKQKHIKKQFCRMVNSGPAGIYALVDYTHFKGLGLQSQKEYKNKKWGLAQVLEDMKGNKIGASAIAEFSNNAKRLIINRVKNAYRKEDQWLLGWLNRIETYNKFK